MVTIGNKRRLEEETVNDSTTSNDVHPAKKIHMMATKKNASRKTSTSTGRRSSSTSPRVQAKVNDPTLSPAPAKGAPSHKVENAPSQPGKSTDQSKDSSAPAGTQRTGHGPRQATSAPTSQAASEPLRAIESRAIPGWFRPTVYNHPPFKGEFEKALWEAKHGTIHPQPRQFTSVEQATRIWAARELDWWAAKRREDKKKERLLGRCRGTTPQEHVRQVQAFYQQLGLTKDGRDPTKAGMFARREKRARDNVVALFLEEKRRKEGADAAGGSSPLVGDSEDWAPVEPSNGRKRGREEDGKEESGELARCGMKRQRVGGGVPGKGIPPITYTCQY